MEKIILSDKTEIEVQTSGIQSITAEVAGYTALATLAERLTKDNLKKVQIMSDDAETGIYENMILREPNFAVTVRTDHLDVTFGIREQTAQEKQQESVEVAISYLTDNQAISVIDLFEDWRSGVKYEKDDRRRYGANLYRCKQSHTSEAQHTPDMIPALWDMIPADNYGTADNPVVIPDEVSSMVYTKGKYYLENGILYLMNREGMNDGEEISLTYKPSQLIGQYFATVE